jgi:PAS domain S-box-containing protein
VERKIKKGQKYPEKILRERTAKFEKTKMGVEESEEWIKVIFEQNLVGVAKVNSNTGEYITTNRKYSEIVGYSQKELLSTDYISVTHPEDIHEHLNNIKRLKKGDISDFSMEKRYLKKDSSIVQVHLTVSPLWKKGDTPSNHIAFITDISSKIEAEEKLRQKNIILNGILDGSKGMFLFGLDKQYSYLFFNKNHQEIMKFYYGADIKLGMNILDKITNQEIRAELKTNYDRALSGEEFTEIQERGDTNNKFYVESSLGPIYNENRDIIGMTAFRKDITEHIRTEEENIYLREEIKFEHNFDEIIGQSESIKKTLKLVEQVANTSTRVLVQGETGTGKELIARAIHHLSSQKNKSLIKINCAAIPSTLIESELFGHEKGAFTGATSLKKGRFELADDGTIFLDEIGDLPLELQAKLLRVLQENEFERLGGTRTYKVNVRVIAATNRDLASLCQEGAFRYDLYYRLSVFPIKCPSLRDRIDDIPILVKHFMNMYSNKTGKNVSSIAKATIKALQSYHWPGNIRELANVIERAVILSPSNKLLLDDWATNIPKPDANACQTLDELQIRHITQVLEQTNGKVSGINGAAIILGLKPTTLNARIKKLGIKIKRPSSQNKNKTFR